MSAPEPPPDATGTVIAVHRSGDHSFSKRPSDSIDVVAGLGVVGDAHQGARVKHRSRVRKDPEQPNLRQVHLIASELLDEVGEAGFDVAPGELGENVTTRGLDLIRLPVGSVVRIGDDVLLALTGLRNPCVQIDAFAEGLQGAMLDRDENGSLIRKTGIMAVVTRGGSIAPGDPIAVRYPAGPLIRMERV